MSRRMRHLLRVVALWVGLVSTGVAGIDFVEDLVAEAAELGGAGTSDGLEVENPVENALVPSPLLADELTFLQRAGSFTPLSLNLHAACPLSRVPRISRAERSPPCLLLLYSQPVILPLRL